MQILLDNWDLLQFFLWPFVFLFSKGGGGGSSSNNALIKEQARYARALFEETSPLRKGLIGSFGKRLGVTTGFEDQAADSALFGPTAPEREAVESQYGRARENVLARVPGRGSDLRKALTNVETARASNVSGLEADATNRALGMAFEPTFNAPGAASTQIGAAAVNRGNAEAAQAQQLQGAGEAIVPAILALMKK